MWHSFLSLFASQEAADVRRFLRHVAFFVLLPTLMYLPFGFMFTEAIMERVAGPSMKKQVLMSFQKARDQDYELLILGNSRMYRGLNPDRFALKAFNFSHDMDTYNQIYHKFKWLDEQGKTFSHVLLGVDYFQFSFINDRRNHVYCTLFDESYAADYPPYPWYSRRRWASPSAIRGMNPFYLFASTSGKARQKPNGQYIVPGEASPDDTVARSSRRLDLQVNYFEKILEHCEQRNVTVFLCLLPLRPAEVAAYEDGAIEEFHDFLENYVDGQRRILVDHTFIPNFTLKDFADITHLNPTGADRYSAELNQTIMRSLADRERPRIQFASESKTLPQSDRPRTF